MGVHFQTWLWGGYANIVVLRLERWLPPLAVRPFQTSFPPAGGLSAAPKCSTASNFPLQGSPSWRKGRDLLQLKHKLSSPLWNVSRHLMALKWRACTVHVYTVFKWSNFLYLFKLYGECLLTLLQEVFSDGTLISHSTVIGYNLNLVSLFLVLMLSVLMKLCANIRFCLIF